jgi:hypothetical protein
MGDGALAALLAARVEIATSASVSLNRVCSLSLFHLATRPFPDIQLRPESKSQYFFRCPEKFPIIFDFIRSMGLVREALLLHYLTHRNKDGPAVKTKMAIKLVSTNIGAAKRLRPKPIDASKLLLFALICYLLGISLLIWASIALIRS